MNSAAAPRMRLAWRGPVLHGLAGQRFLTAILVLACLLPLAICTLPPLVDLPGHMGRYEIQLNLADDPWLQKFFGFEWKLIGNLGHDLLIEVLAPILGLETTVGVLVIATQALAATGIVLLCREVHGRITAFALFALPLIYGFPFTFGFTNFSLSMALSLLAFTLWLRLGRAGRESLRAVVFIPLSLALWLCHTYGWVFLGVLCTGEALSAARRDGAGWIAALSRTARTCAPLLAPVLPMLLWRSDDAGGATQNWFVLETKVAWLLMTLRLDNSRLDMLSVIVLLVVVMLGARAWRLPRHAGLSWAAAICLAAFIAMPSTVFGSNFADMRLVPYLLIVALLSISDEALAPRLRQPLLFAGIAFLAFRLVLTAQIYEERSEITRERLALLTALPDRARLATLVQNPCVFDWAMSWDGHIGSMALVRRHAFVNDQWVVSGMNLLDVDYPEAGRFASDDSQLVNADGCGPDALPNMREAIAAVPAHAFTHVWLVDDAGPPVPARSDLRLVQSAGHAALYEFVATPEAGERR